MGPVSKHVIMTSQTCVSNLNFPNKVDSLCIVSFFVLLIILCSMVCMILLGVLKKKKGLL